MWISGCCSRLSLLQQVAPVSSSVQHHLGISCIHALDEVVVGSREIEGMQITFDSVCAEGVERQGDVEVLDQKTVQMFEVMVVGEDVRASGGIWCTHQRSEAQHACMVKGVAQRQPCTNMWSVHAVWRLIITAQSLG